MRPHESTLVWLGLMVTTALTTGCLELDTGSTSSSGSTSSGMIDYKVLERSELGVALANDGGAVACAPPLSPAPVGADRPALVCTHITNQKGYFRQGLQLDAVANRPYTVSFFFQNHNFDVPFDQAWKSIGIMAIAGSPLVEEGASLSTIKPYPNGWYRQIFTFSPTSSQTYGVGFNQAVERAPGGEYQLFGFQIEEGDQATEYVPAMP